MMASGGGSATATATKGENGGGPGDPAFERVCNAINDYMMEVSTKNGGDPTQAASFNNALGAFVYMLGQQGAPQASDHGHVFPGPGGQPPTAPPLFLTPQIAHRHRGQRLLLGRGPEPTLPNPAMPRNFSDSNLIRGGQLPYTEAFARFSLGNPAAATPPMRPRPPYPNHWPSPPDFSDIDDFGLDDILNNRAMLAAANAVGGTYPPRSNIRRSKMIYYLKFGEAGQEPGKFSEPSGVAVTEAGDLVVADTNNHRIQVFHPDGRFKFSFGECGKRDGQLLYPNRVAVNKKTGDIVITERSPTHQIQVYNQYGQFLAKFGATILQHPRGVTVDSKGRIIVVECKVMRVLIFEMGGALVGRFDCSSHLEFPNGVCVNDQEEIFVSDNRAHAVKVFDYAGNLLRTIGGEGITNFPIGVGINHLGQVVVADNHNNFNCTVFDQVHTPPLPRFTSTEERGQREKKGEED